MFHIPGIPFHHREGLLQMNSLCFWEENLALLLHLLFLSSLLVEFLCRKLGISCTRSVKEEKGAQSYSAKKYSHGNMNLAFSYKFSIFSCSILSVTHLLKLLLSLLEERGNCNSILSVLLSEIAQTISWSVAIAMVASFRKWELLKLPLILRIWWVCSFLQSLIATILHVDYSLSMKQFLRVQEYAGILSLLTSMYLFFVSIRGTTGISFSTDTTTEPLLQADTEKRAEGKRDSLYARATLIQIVTFSWLNPLFVIGKRKALEQDEVPDVDVKDSAAFLSHSFEDCLNHVKETHGMKESTIYRAIFLFIRKKAAMNAAFAVLTACASYVGPYLIADLVSFLSEKKKYSMRRGYILSFAFLGAKIVETVTQRQWIFGARRLGMHLRAALISHIYKKGLHLSSLSRQSHTSGEIINYMNVDIQRITDFIWYSNTIWMLPIQISLAIYILHMNLGLGSVAALAATSIVMACNIPITTTQKRYQTKIMEAKDERMRATAEVLRNMKTLKVHAWDGHYLNKLQSLRGIEYKCLWRSLRLHATSAFIFWGAPTFISAVTFGVCILMGIPLTTGRVLSALATFRMLQDPIFNLPDLLSVIAQAKVSVDRVASYLREDEIQPDAVEFIPRNEGEIDVEIDGGIFSWNAEPGSPTLENIYLKVKRGMKVAICGTVGSGKSSLLSSILGEIPKLAGTVRVAGSKAYVPQSPWILTGNVRENILFGKPYECEKYEKTVQACALVKDLELFASGDLTEIGERGINMSGGQKQRIQIARAAYQDADIYLLDDPFSAVDAHTGTQLFKDCMRGILKDKTILYVTHQVEFLPAADIILVMKNGRIAQAGKFEELLQENVGFEMLVGAHSQALESILVAGNAQEMSQAEDRRKMGYPSNEEADEEHAASIQFQSSDKLNSEQDLSINLEERGRIIQDEEREKGSIGKKIYLAYLTAVRGGAFVPIILTAQSLFQILQVASNYWMAWASPPTTGVEPTVSLNLLFLVYVILSVGSSLCVLLRAMLVAITGLLTAEKFFTNMLHSVMHAPMSFFDTTPTGRILNRASSDQSVLDMELATKLGWCAFSVIQILGTIAVMSQVAWPVFAIFVPVTTICILYQQYYIPTARELARLSEIQRAPILHHFAESLSGASVIRAFEQGDRFSSVNLRLVDSHSRPWFHNVSAMEWLSFRLNLLSHLVFAFSLVLLVSLPDGFINPSIAGLAVTYGLNLNVQQASIIWNMCNAENKMISVERILQYTRIKSEAPLHVEGHRPPESWPEIGAICFRNLQRDWLCMQVRYADHLPSVLKHITCTFPGKKKIGVVGRTGSGKSTLIQAIFRIVEPREGSIVIDDIDICKIGLHDLRSRLSIIPQDPTMFEGTVRGNLDPLDKYSDLQVWEALNKCQLADLVREKEKKLDSSVVENGENWSVGQRQLFCLGRALLKRSNILVLDEATASVDSATDGIIQQIIRQEFKDNTVITIAHRIHTVIDSDLVLVLSEGKVQEYDAPAKLLEREDSAFAKLIKEYSLRSHSFNNLASMANAIGKKKYSMRSGYILAIAFLGAKIVETVAQRQWVFGGRQLAMRLRAALISQIYRKGLHLSSLSRQKHTSGEIINYMSVDVQRITDFIWYLNTMWMLPIQISLAIYILHMNLGLGSVAALASTCILMACNVPITRTQKIYQSRIMEAKDQRMKATSEVLRNMRTLKLHAWDGQYLCKLVSLRKVEYKCLWKSQRLQAVSALVSWEAPTFISAVTFGACILMGIPLTAGRVLSALATFKMLQDPIYKLPDLLSSIAQSKVSADRVASYLQEDEIRQDAVEFIPRNEGVTDIEIDDGRFSWDFESNSPNLEGIQLTVKRGMKVAVCGTVGSGKSSLLSCVLGEIPKLAGRVRVAGSKAYVPQNPWILSGNIRVNILFGKPYDSEKYDKTVQACALVKDFELFASGDLTEIGERGINMSGGQKQRIQIARAVYQDADIYLLDDPFSAVDAHTGTHLFKECLMGILKDKTILYVTHQVEFLPAADLILVMKNGRIAQAGKFEELLQANEGFEMLAGAHSQALESIYAVGNAHRMTPTDNKMEMEPPSSEEEDEEHAASIQVQNSGKHNSERDLSVKIAKKGRITQDEEREKGSIGKEVYWTYLTAVRGGAFVPVILIAQSLFQALQVASHYWMAWASPPTTGVEPKVGLDSLLLVYIILSVGSALCLSLRVIILTKVGLLTSEKFFKSMLHSIMHAPMSFFDSTPTGRILNRASTDQSVLDFGMAAKLGWCAFSVIQILGTIAVMSQVAWPIFATFIPVTALCVWYQQYYTPAARELARLSGIQRAPILHHFTESLSGASVIRAFEQGDRFSSENLCLIDHHSRPWFHNFSAMEWLSFRLNLLSHFVFAFSLVLLVSLPDGFISPNIAGLAVTYGLSLNVQQASIIWTLCDTANKIISVERILQYSRIKSEAPLHVEGCRPPDSWPEIGTICFRNLEVRYAEHLPSVLKHITCTFPGKKKIGVVGRTGSGKSTLVQAIFRIVEPREGSIVIDGIDICKIGLHDLRSRLGIIPQDPTMFQGNVRRNLDPLEKYSDPQVWENTLGNQKVVCTFTVVENGENWSVGQRQLLCLGRALLKRSSILVLDEATASVDTATDGTIQTIIRQEFKDNTVVTIAHRIHTVVDSDLVVVLSEGKVQEYDAPAKLLGREDSAFSKLIKGYSLRSHSFNDLANMPKAMQ
ncbi:hypothetical protein Taro_050625 [Colocasia esculenta]|uniref:ABC transporter C family member 15 n=1 Tax=Colocasia esculenta TaxID=4460 RepID=A0A843XEH4_COLES|nr:hypothetical protein [Colocasia esculenta]